MAVRFWKACPFHHDHPNADGYADCVAAYEHELRRVRTDLRPCKRCKRKLAVPGTTLCWRCADAQPARRSAIPSVCVCADGCPDCSALCASLGHRFTACACGHDRVHEHVTDAAGVRYCRRCSIPCPEEAENHGT